MLMLALGAAEGSSGWLSVFGNRYANQAVSIHVLL
jgi:hypothetical protein